MAKARLEWVRTIPDERMPSTVYFLRSETGGLVDIYLTDKTGTELRHIFGLADAEALIQDSIRSLAGLLVVDNIAERDELDLDRNTQILVLDATGDPSVSSGAANYLYRAETQEFIKISEFESMDVTLTWSNIQGRPTSAPEEIDQAVDATHSHENGDVLSKFSEKDGSLTYNGETVVVVGQSDW